MLSVLVTTIVAAAVGAVASLAVNAVQWRRDDKLKWDPERRIAYERFVTSIDRWDELDDHAAVNGELEEWFDAPLDDRLEPLTGVYESSRLRPRANAAASEARSRSRRAGAHRLSCGHQSGEGAHRGDALSMPRSLRLAATGLRRRCPSHSTSQSTVTTSHAPSSSTLSEQSSARTDLGRQDTTECARCCVLQPTIWDARRSDLVVL